MNNYYSYQESLDIVEKFMIDSGIREYCETICKGKCCGGCYESKYACRKNEGRRLSCSTMICEELRNFIFSDETKRSYENIDHCMWRKFITDCDLTDIHFNVHTDYVKSKFKIAKRFFNYMKGDIGDIKSKVQHLIDNNIQVRKGEYMIDKTF